MSEPRDFLPETVLVSTPISRANLPGQQTTQAVASKAQPDDLFRQLSAMAQTLDDLSKKVSGLGPAANGNGSLPLTEIPTIMVSANGSSIRPLSAPTYPSSASPSLDLMTIRVKVPRNLGQAANGNPELMTVPVKVPRMLAGASSEILASVVAQGLQASAASSTQMGTERGQSPPIKLSERPNAEIERKENSQGEDDLSLEEESVRIGRDISLRDVFFMVRERWIHGLTTGLLLAVGFAYWALNKPKMYEAQAELVIEAESDKVLPTLQKVEDTNLADSYYMDKALEIHDKRLVSSEYRNLVMATYQDNEKAAYVKISREEAFAEKKSAPQATDDAQLFAQQFGVPRVIRPKESQFFTIAYRHRDPAVAQLAANRYIENYSRFLNAESRSAHARAHAWLDERVSTLRVKIEESERVIQEYRKKHGIVEDNQNNSQTASKLDTLGQQVTSADLEIVDLVIQIKLIEDLGASNMRQLLEHPMIGKFGSVQEVKSRLDTNQQEFSQLDIKYGRRHPKIIANAREREALENILKQNIQQALGDLKNKLSKSEKQKEQLLTAFSTAEKAQIDSGDPIVEYKVKQRSLDLDKTAYDQMLSRMNETVMGGELESTNIKVIRLAFTPDEPVIPDRKKTSRTALLLLLGSFFGVPIGVGFLDMRLKSFSEAQAFLRKECLGVVPEKRSIKEADLAQCVLRDKDEGVVEGFRTIYGALELASKFSIPKTLLVSSAAPGEGKSFISSNLAAMFARHGYRALIIDCDLRRPSQHKHLRLKNDAGLLKWLDAGANLSSTIDGLYQDSSLGLVILGDGLTLLRSGGSTKNPSEIFQNRDFEKLIHFLQGHFDLIVLDTPPVGLFPDALFLAHLAEESIFVCKHNGVNRHKIKFALTKLDRSPAPVVGTVMNQLSASRRHQYGYGYRDYGYGYYGGKDYAKYYRDKED